MMVSPRSSPSGTEQSVGEPIRALSDVHDDPAVVGVVRRLQSQSRSVSFERRPSQASSAVRSKASAARSLSERATMIAEQLVPRSTLLRAEKLEALVRGTGELPRMDAKHASDGARLLVGNFQREVAYDKFIRSNYVNLAIFLAYVVAMLTMITLQRDIANASGRLQGLAARNIWLNLGSGVTRDESVVDTELVNETGILAHLRNQVGTIFRSPVEACGNYICEKPDEFPAWDARAETPARDFGGCETDCGRVATQEVVVHFFDAFKYKRAYERILALARAERVRGYTPLQWGVVDSDGAVIRPPVAGWNICSRDIARPGSFENICVFDGDVAIDGCASARNPNQFRDTVNVNVPERMLRGLSFRASGNSEEPSNRPVPTKPRETSSIRRR